ncbi:hypothetical protein GCM10011346_41700 [Oceanobacillus neutriphilus]|uniref:Uncharacterized protein n=1 Tax=Oceanobacillus neutriphilus TaxID=531815 RepID=A0ABQ2P099_9BACI|nr:hypothetical protein GCM10011346_41700 [Oceanobacillus neutriphilus]
MFFANLSGYLHITSAKIEVICKFIYHFPEKFCDGRALNLDGYEFVVKEEMETPLSQD